MAAALAPGGRRPAVNARAPSSMVVSSWQLGVNRAFDCTRHEPIAWSLETTVGAGLGQLEKNSEPVSSLSSLPRCFFGSHQPSVPS